MAKKVVLELVIRIDEYCVDAISRKIMGNYGEIDTCNNNLVGYHL